MLKCAKTKGATDQLKVDLSHSPFQIRNASMNHRSMDHGTQKTASTDHGKHNTAAGTNETEALVRSQD